MIIAGKKTESGVVLIAVVAFVVVVSVMILGVLSRNVSQTVSVEDQVRHIQAEQLRKGAVWFAKVNMDAGLGVSGTLTESMDGRAFDVNFANAGSTVTINVNY